MGDALKLRLTISREASDRYLAFARSPAALWSGNFRDFGASVRRMATLCEGGRISVREVEDEVANLRGAVAARGDGGDAGGSLVERSAGRRVARRSWIGSSACSWRTCCASAGPRGSLSEAGRMLFAASRSSRSTTNDADRLRKYLARYGLYVRRGTSSVEKSQEKNLDGLTRPSSPSQSRVEEAPTNARL